MRARGSGSPRNFAILGALLALAAIPAACAQGLVLSDTGPTGQGGGSTTTVSVTTSGVVGGSGGNGTSNGGFGGTPAGVTSSNGPSTSEVSSSQVSSSSGGPSSVCDGEGDCGLCASCANCLLCSGQADACANSPACTNIVTCAGGCAQGDTACVEQCLTSNPSGEQLFNDYNDCLGCACVEDCMVPPADCP